MKQATGNRVSSEDVLDLVEGDFASVWPSPLSAAAEGRPGALARRLPRKPDGGEYPKLNACMEKKQAPGQGGRLCGQTVLLAEMEAIRILEAG